VNFKNMRSSELTPFYKFGFVQVWPDWAAPKMPAPVQWQEALQKSKGAAERAAREKAHEEARRLHYGRNKATRLPQILHGF
jgi:hypothetical protein